MASASKPFDRTTLEQALYKLGEIAVQSGKIVEISIYGGSALVLTTNFRVATGDVDALFEADRSFVRLAAKQIADDFGWDDDWINDGIKGFLSARDAETGSKTLFKTYPSEGEPGLRVFVASPAYLFAMKCLAMRIGGTDQNQDIEDIRHLGLILGITTADAAISAVMRYYPSGRIPPKTKFGLEEIFGGPPAQD